MENTDVLNQVARLVGQMKEQQAMSLIDPREFGRLEAQVSALESKMDDLETKVDAVDTKLNRLVELASEGKGGIRTLWFVGTVVAFFLGWFGSDKILK